MSKRFIFTLAILIAAVALAAPVASGQESIDIKNGTIVSVGQDSIFIREANGTVREFDVAPGFKVNVDGKEMPVQDLKPGMKITAAIKTVNKPVVVQTTELKNAKVIKNAGGLLYVREADGIHSYNIPAGFRFNIGGAKLSVGELQQDQHLNATIVHTAKGNATEQEVASASATDEAYRKAQAEKAAADKAAAEKAAADKAAADRAAAEKAAADRAAADKAAADAAAARAAQEAAEAAKAQQAMAKSLPKTASSVPLAGALGALCVSLGAALTLRRKLG